MSDYPTTEQVAQVVARTLAKMQGGVTHDTFRSLEPEWSADPFALLRFSESMEEDQ